MSVFGKNFQELESALSGKSIVASNPGSRVLATSAGDIIEVNTHTTFNGVGRTVFFMPLQEEWDRHTIILHLHLKQIAFPPSMGSPSNGMFHLLVETYGISTARPSPHYLPLMTSYEYASTEFAPNPIWVHPVKVTTGKSLLESATRMSKAKVTLDEYGLAL